MTIDTTTTVPAPPAWMNLDAYCPPEIRAALAQALDDLDEVSLAFSAACCSAFLAARRYMAATDAKAPEVDDPTETFGPFTGWARLRETLHGLHVLVACASGDVGDAGPSDPRPYLPEWYLPLYDDAMGIVSPLDELEGDL